MEYGMANIILINMGIFDKYLDQSYKKVVRHYDLDDDEFFVDTYANQPVMGRACDVWANGVVVIKTPGYSGELTFQSGQIMIAHGQDERGYWLYTKTTL